MSKVLLVILTAAALLYAAYLVIFRRQMPDPKNTKGLKRRFILATLLFVGMFGIMPARAAKKNPPRPTCYTPAPIRVDQPGTRRQLAVTLKAVWRTLDPNRAQEFRNKLEKAAGEKVIRQKTADMLAIAFAEVAFHKDRTRGEGARMTCYKMTPLGGTLSTTRENILKQIELLENARKSGKIDEETSKKALTVLACEVEMLYRAKALDWPKDRNEQDQLIKEYKDGKLIAGDSATIAAKLIVEMEDGKMTDLTPAKRLASMKERVETLLSGSKKDYGTGGPVGNDWMDPGINPNIYDVLEKAGILTTSRIRMSCYDRVASPVTARSAELKELQQQLLDKNVRAGVLDVEVAEKAAFAIYEPVIDYATETDIRDYQKKVRRVMRMLYKHGELPLAFVKKIEQAVDVEIISFNSTKALRNDARWHLRSLFWRRIGDEIIKTLEQRKLIDPARNHRRMMNWAIYNKPIYQEDLKKDLARFIKHLDSKEEIKLDADVNKTIKKHQLPQTDLKYRLEVRRVCRVLVKAGFVKPNHLKNLEEVIGIPIIGVIEK